VAVEDRRAMSTSLWPLCCEWSRSISNARSEVVEWRVIRMPIACSIRVADQRALGKEGIGRPAEPRFHPTAPA
jgi:hypothetical protein